MRPLLLFKTMSNGSLHIFDGNEAHTFDPVQAGKIILRQDTGSETKTLKFRDALCRTGNRADLTG